MSENLNPDGWTEPSEESREAAKSVRQIFLALVFEGFNERQALTIVGQMISVASGGKK